MAMADIPEEEVLAPAAPVQASIVSSPASSPTQEGQVSPESTSPVPSPGICPQLSPSSPMSPLSQAAGATGHSPVPRPRQARAQSTTTAPSGPGMKPPTSPKTPSGEVRIRTYAASPHTLRLNDCGCVRFRHGDDSWEKDHKTVADTIHLMLERLDKMLRRLCGMKPHREICDAATRVCYELRSRGYELYHLAGWEEPPHVANQGRAVTETQPARREISIVFMVPTSSDIEPSGHHVLAQIVVHLACSTRHPRQLENVAVRYEDDWEDWTVCQDFDFFTDPQRPKLERKRLGEAGRESAVQVCEAMWRDVVQVLDGQCGEAQGEFRNRLVRVIARLVEEGLVMASYEVELGWRHKSRSGRHYPVVRIPILALPTALFGANTSGKSGDGDASGAAATNSTAPEEARDQEITEEGQGMTGASAREGDLSDEAEAETTHSRPVQDELGERRDDSHDSTPDTAGQKVKTTCAAVMLVDVSCSNGRYKVKHIAVVYDGEWPLAHLYRKNIPAPDMAGLADCLRA